LYLLLATESGKSFSIWTLTGGTYILQ